MASPLPSPLPGRCFTRQRKVRTRWLQTFPGAPRSSILIGPIGPPGLPGLGSHCSVGGLRGIPRWPLPRPCLLLCQSPAAKVLKIPSIYSSGQWTRRTYAGSQAASHIFKLKCLLWEKTLFLSTSPDTDLDGFPWKIIYNQVLKINEVPSHGASQGWTMARSHPGFLAPSCGPGQVLASHCTTKGLAFLTLSAEPIWKKQKQITIHVQMHHTNLIPPKPDKANSPPLLGELLLLLPLQASLP